MEENGSSRLEGIEKAIRKKRSHIFRRPRPESQSVPNGYDISPLSSAPLSDDLVAGSSDENNGGRFPGTSGRDEEKPMKKCKKTEIGLDELYNSRDSRDSGEQGRTGMNHKRSSEGELAPANWKSLSELKEGSEPQKTLALNEGKIVGACISSVDGLGNESKVKKVKLKVGGVTRTIDANSSLKASHGSETAVQRLKFVHKGNTNSTTPPTDKKGGLQGIPWKDFSRGGFSLGREESTMVKGKSNNSVKQEDKTDPVRKSKRAPKKRSRDGFDDDDDDEIRYLEKLKSAKVSALFDTEGSSKKHMRLSKFSGDNSEKVGKDNVKKYEDTDYDEEDEAVSDGEVDGKKKKKGRLDLVESRVEPKQELTLTTRQRALQSGRDTSSPGGNGVEFPNGLPPAPSRSKQKEQLSEVEQQLRKAEIAQRRRMQNEKAARESEAEAIRKILGQDSNRKKREEKKKKREEELAQEKAAEELIRVSNSIRWVDGPNGVTVTFPKEMGFPSIFNSKCSYPPPRETCAGPSCKNPYKYRDSKTRLPLCSLQCYKAVQGNPPG